MNNTATITNKSLQHKAVVSLGDGAKIGHVEDILIDPQTLTVVALVIKGEKGESVLPREHINTIGEDAVTINDISATQSTASSFPGMHPFSEFRGHKVVDSAGTVVGELHDVDLDPTTGAICALGVRSGGIFGVGSHTLCIPAADICSFGPELITVRSTGSEVPAN